MKAALHKDICLAVLPLQLLTAEEPLQYLATGFTDDLIINFSRFSGLSVISQYSTRHINYPEDSAQLDQLGVDYVVTGSIRSLGDTVRISIQLVRSDTKAVLFARQYDETVQTIVQALDTIARQVVNALQQQIDYNLLADFKEGKTTQFSAYYQLLRGMEALKKGTLEGDEEARQYFGEALKIDPNYARAYSGISLSYFNEWTCQLWDRWDITSKGAREYALKALELDENDYIALMVLGRTYLYTEEYQVAETCLRKSFDLNPNDANNLVQVAFWMTYLGNTDEAQQLFERARQLNPLHPNNYYIYGAFIYFEAGKFEKSLELARKLPLESTYIDFPVYLAAAYFHLGDRHKAQEYWAAYLNRFREKIYTGNGPFETEALGWHIRVNPYRDGQTQLRPFWDFIQKTDKKSDQPEFQKSATEPSERAVFREAGEVWEVYFQGKSATLKAVKGYSDIARLLGEPEREFHCAELMGSVLHQSAGVELIDPKAKQAYQKRLAELREEMDEAETLHDSARASRLAKEYDQLLEHLSGALGMGGKLRKTGSSVEKARSAVTWRIRNAIKKLEAAHPALAKHLSLSVKTGTFCAYCPESVMHWET